MAASKSPKVSAMLSGEERKRISVVLEPERKKSERQTH